MNVHHDVSRCLLSSTSHFCNTFLQDYDAVECQCHDSIDTRPLTEVNNNECDFDCATATRNFCEDRLVIISVDDYIRQSMTEVMPTYILTKSVI